MTYSGIMASSNMCGQTDALALTNPSPPQWSLPKWFCRPLLILEVPGNPGNLHCHNWILVVNLTSYTSGRCSVWLTVSQWLRTMKSSSLWHHGSIRQLHPKVWSWDAPSQTLPVSAPFYFNPTNERLLWNPRANIPWLEGHGIGFCNIDHESKPYEEADDNIDFPLN